jgi:hypothetical protein
MGFQVIEPGHWKTPDPLAEGEVSVNKEGRIIFRREDLTEAGIEGFCVLLADPMTLRIAVRKPREGEAGRSLVVSTIKGHKDRDSGRRAVNAARGIKALKLDPAACAGRYTLMTKDELLILGLANAEFGDDREHTK